MSAQATRELEAAVLTSSSMYSLDDLVSEVIQVTGVACFDLLLLRDSDVIELDRQGILRPESPADTTVDKRAHTRLMAESPWERIADWIIAKFEPFRATTPGLRVPALATYYPEIASLSSERRDLAVDALTNTIRIALKLKDAGLMTEPIVEIVCGQLLDTCECGACKDQVFIAPKEEKYAHLLESCLCVIDRGRAVCPGVGA